MHCIPDTSAVNIEKLCKLWPFHAVFKSGAPLDISTTYILWEEDEY